MKRALILVVAAAFLLAGCEGLQVLKSDEQTVVIKTAARVVGYKIAKNNPELTRQALPQAIALYAAGTGTQDQAQYVNVLFPAAVNLLLQYIHDPLMAASVADIVGLVRVDMSTQMKVIFIQAGLQGFIEGMQLAEANI